MRKLDDLHPIDAVRVLVVTGEPDPRILQFAFTGANRSGRPARRCNGTAPHPIIAAPAARSGTD